MEDREIKLFIAFLIILIAFFYGAFSTALEIFPYRYLENQLKTAKSVQQAMQMEKYNAEMRWKDPATAEAGVSVRDDARMQPGLTLFSSTHDTAVRLVDAGGETRHTWTLSFNDIWENQDHIISLVDLEDRHFLARDFHLFDNGDIIIMVHGMGITPWGVGLVKLDKDSNVIWKYSGYVNNDFEVGPDGRIYAIEHTIRQEKPDGIEEYDVPFLEDNVVILDENGEVLQRISLIAAIENSSYRAFLQHMQFDEDVQGDPTHSNSVKMILRDNPDVPWLRKGSLLVSVRNLNAALVLDPETEEIMHVRGLISRMQHDMDYLENGRFLIFDNQGDFEDEGYSRVIEIDPRTQEVYWAYKGAGLPAMMNSEFWGAQQRLPNGNTLIANAEAGQIVEVARDGSLVWVYTVPLTKTYNGAAHIATVTTAERIDADKLNFELKGE